MELAFTEATHVVQVSGLLQTGAREMFSGSVGAKNLRYADDLMILATSREELVFMVETLAQELSPIGLHLRGTNTKVLTTSTLQEASHVEIVSQSVSQSVRPVRLAASPFRAQALNFIQTLHSHWQQKSRNLFKVCSQSS